MGKSSHHIVPGQSGLFGRGPGIDAIVIDFSKAFDLVHDRLLTKLEASGVDSRVVVWLREFLVGRTKRVRVGGQLSKEVKVTSGVLQGSVLGPLLFAVYVNGIWRLFADDCMIYGKITNKNDIEKLQKDLGEWTVENGMKISTGKSKAIRFTRARVKNSLGYSLGKIK